MLHPILRQGIRLFIGTTSKTRNYILLSTRGRRSCYSRPRVALPSAASSITFGRESMTLTITDFTLHFSCCFTKLLHSLFITLLNNFTM